MLGGCDRNGYGRQSHGKTTNGGEQRNGALSDYSSTLLTTGSFEEASEASWKTMQVNLAVENIPYRRDYQPTGKNCSQAGIYPLQVNQNIVIQRILFHIHCEIVPEVVVCQNRPFRQLLFFTAFHMRDIGDHVQV